MVADLNLARATIMLTDIMAARLRRLKNQSLLKPARLIQSLPGMTIRTGIMVLLAIPVRRTIRTPMPVPTHQQVFLPDMTTLMATMIPCPPLLTSEQFST